MTQITIGDEIPNFCAAIVEARGVTLGASTPRINEYCDRVVASVTEHGMVGGEIRLRNVRDLLRSGGYKPAGRNKPAQEYLLRTAMRDGRLPRILNAVDLINVVSLCSGLPISLLSLDKIGESLTIRYGRERESYPFNEAQQSLELKGLICVCAREGETSRPVGSPVKDSMRGKVSDADRNVVAIVYGSLKTAGRDELRHWGRELAQRFSRWCQATSVEDWLVESST